MEQPSAADRERFEPLQTVIEEAIAEGAFPGASWGVVQHGRLRALGAAGGFTYEPGSPRVQPETVYDLASVSKVVATTAAAMLLYERGRLDLDELLGDLLPGFAVASGSQPESGFGTGLPLDSGFRSGRRRVTVRMVLAHASGLPAYAPLFMRQSAKCPDAAALMRECLWMALTAAPGTRAEYSDIGFILLGKALEMVAGESLASFCRREVFEPLGMKQTRYRPVAGSHGAYRRTVDGREAIPPTELDKVFRHRVVQGEVHDENCWVLGGCAGHAGLFAPVGDVLRFAEGVLMAVRDVGRELSASGSGPGDGPGIDQESGPERDPEGGPGIDQESGRGRDSESGPGMGADSKPASDAGRGIFQPGTVKLFTKRAELPHGSSRALGWDTPSGPSSSGISFAIGSAGHLGYTGTSLWIDPQRDLGVVLLTNRTWPSRENKQISVVRPRFHDALAKLL